MKKEEFADRLSCACASVISAEQELTEIDSHFGDADHGLTMKKIAGAIDSAVKGSDGGIKEMLDDAAMAVMVLNGGSAVPLWNAWLDGMQEDAPEGDEIDVSGIKAVFKRAFEELDSVSGAYKGSDENELFAIAARAAADGAEASRQFVSKFGRAKSYGTQTIGTPDAGAVSMAYFFRGLARA